MGTGSIQAAPRSGTVVSVDSRRERALARADGELLTERERAELAYLWGGYEAALGARSIHGAIRDRLLRAPPSDVRRAIVDRLVTHGNHAERDRLEEDLVNEGLATRRELHLAVTSLLRTRHLRAEVSEVERRRPRAGCEDGSTDPYTVPIEHLHLERTLEGEAPPHLTNEERWARADAELEAFCRGGPECDDAASPTHALPAMGAGMPTAKRALERMDPLHRRVLERVYGSGGIVNRADVFGPTLARIAELTNVVESKREEIVRERFTSRLGRAVDVHADAERAWQAANSRARTKAGKLRKTLGKGLRHIIRHGRPQPLDEAALLRDVDAEVKAEDAIRVMLDSPPESVEARRRWQAARAAFVSTVRKQAEGLLVAACRAYRFARGT